jgi:hypothetical protein
MMYIYCSLQQIFLEVSFFVPYTKTMVAHFHVSNFPTKYYQFTPINQNMRTYTNRVVTKFKKRV